MKKVIKNIPDRDCSKSMKESSEVYAGPEWTGVPIRERLPSPVLGIATDSSIHRFGFLS